ncbi:MAG: SOS response-associated peptidase family protein [Ferruginibacter sp.]
MCHDLSFTANTVHFITDILPAIILDGQLGIDFCTTSHVLSMSNRKCLCIYSRDGKPHLNEFEWGLVADYMKTPELIKKYRIQMTNARKENIVDKKSAWYRVRNNRCLIAVDGIYEHRQVTGWKNKIPYFIKLKQHDHLLIPGFYNYSPVPDPETGEMKGTFSVITRPANLLMQKIHNHGPNKHRMPVFMEPKKALEWIREDLTDNELTEFLNYEIAPHELDVWPVYMIRTTKERPDGKDKWEKFIYEGLPDLDNDGEARIVQKGLFD